MANRSHARSSKHSGPRWSPKFWEDKVPVVLQAERSECGLACLAMVAAYHGCHCELHELRARFPSSLRGSSVRDILFIANELGILGQAYRAPVSDLDAMLKSGPALLHWHGDHFVLLVKSGRKRWVIHDPAGGRKILSDRDFRTAYSGTAVIFETAEAFEPRPPTKAASLRALLGRFHGLPGILVQIGVLAVALEAIGIVWPFYIQWVLDNAITSMDRSLVLTLALGFACIVLFQSALTLLRSWLLTWLGAVVLNQWGKRVVQHLMRLPSQWFEARNTGDIMSRLGSVQAIQRTLTTQFIGSILDGVMSLVLIAMMWLYAPKLAVIIVAVMILYALIRAAFFAALWRANERHVLASATLQGDTLEIIRGIVPLKLGNMIQSRVLQQAELLQMVAATDVSLQKTNASFFSANQVIFGIGRVVVIAMAALMAMDGAFTGGMIMAFLAYADQFNGRSISFIDRCVEYRMLKLHVERLADIALSDVECDSSCAWMGQFDGGDIEFSRVSYRYPGQHINVLEDVSFRIGGGEAVAIVGPSGSGKTTLAKLMLGLLQPTSGEVRFGGIPISTIDLKTYRSNVAAVLQDDQLFAGTIASNVSFGTEATLDSIVEACALAGIHEEINRMPLGYQSLVGDMGSSLSGGQKQRVILARALHRKPRLLVLDEATSHLDVAMEQAVNERVRALPMTRIIIAHRPQTIASADRVVSLGVDTSATLGINA